MNRRSALTFSPGAAGPLLSGDWRHRAACATASPALFFPVKGRSATPAKAVCADCPVRAECLAFALGNGERDGVWGGFSERERRQLRSAGGRLRRCRNSLHEMTDENTTADGKCRACKRKADRLSRRRRHPAARPRPRLAA